jgi:hypothetical protein
MDIQLHRGKAKLTVTREELERIKSGLHSAALQQDVIRERPSPDPSLWPTHAAWQATCDEMSGKDRALMRQIEQALDGRGW